MNGVIHAAKDRKVGQQNSEQIGNKLLHQGGQSYIRAVSDQSTTERHTLFILPEACIFSFGSFSEERFHFQVQNVFHFFFEGCRHDKRCRMMKTKISL